MQSLCLILVATIVIGVINIDASSRSRRFGKSRVYFNRFRGRGCFHQPLIANGAIKPTGSGQLFTYTCNEGFELKVQARCRGPWLPIITCQDIDECADSPCLNNGTCTDRINGFTCNCPAGFTGETCETNIDDCMGSPCLNNGTCIDGINSFTCNCPAGFTGETCETNIDDCAGSPCLNNGTCIDRINNYTCNCASGFTGDNCEDVDCVMTSSNKTKIRLHKNGALLSEAQNLNKTGCEHPCNGNESCTGVYFYGYCAYTAVGVYIPSTPASNEDTCIENCQSHPDCLRQEFISICFRYKEPVLEVMSRSTLADCKAQCFNRKDCVSLSYSSRYCYLFNNNTDNLITKRDTYYTTYEKLC